MKVLALIDEDEVLLKACQQMDEIKKASREKHKFLQKQIEDLKEAHDKQCEPIWEAIQNRLKEKGRLPSYNQETQHLCFSIEENAIELHDNEEEGPPEALKAFLLHLAMNKKPT